MRAESGRPRGAACPGEDSNLHVRKRTLAPQASASASSATWAGDARGGSRTPTGVKSHRILNPARLPVPPPEPAPLNPQVREVSLTDRCCRLHRDECARQDSKPVTSCSGGKRSIQAELRAQTRNASPEEATRRGSNLTESACGVHKVYRALRVSHVSHASLEEPLKKVSLDMPRCVRISRSPTAVTGGFRGWVRGAGSETESPSTFQWPPLSGPTRSIFPALRNLSRPVPNGGFCDTERGSDFAAAGRRVSGGEARGRGQRVFWLESSFSGWFLVVFWLFSGRS